jgi:hypothetical protein
MDHLDFAKVASNDFGIHALEYTQRTKAVEICWAIDNTLTQKVSAGDPIQIAALKGGVAGSVNLAHPLATPNVF